MSLFLIMSGDKKEAVQFLCNAPWFQAVIEERLDKVWNIYGCGALKEVYKEMDRDMILVQITWETAMFIYDHIELDKNMDDQSVRNIIRKYAKDAVKGAWNRIFFEYATELYPALGSSVSTFRRRIELYNFIRKNSLTDEDLDKSNDEIIASLDLDAVLDRYRAKGQSIGDILNRLNHDLNQIRLWLNPCHLDMLKNDLTVFTADDVLQYIADEDFSKKFSAALSVLPEKEQTVAKMAIAGYSNQEIAEVIGLSSEGAARYQRKKIASAIEKEM